MIGETENPVLELLRGMRADMSAINVRLSAIEERLDAMDLQLERWRYLFLATVGSLAADRKRRGIRIAALEGTPA